MDRSNFHRAGLTRENLSPLESSRSFDLDRSEYSRYSKPSPSKTSELDVLWRSVGKTSADTRVAKQKAPGVYLLIGFICGALFMGVISAIAGFSNLAGSQKTEEIIVQQAPKANVAVIGPDTQAPVEAVSVPSEEKYEVKSGDTLDGIAYRFYGKYDVEKIEAIQKLNNIVDPSSLQIGQVILIPVDTRRQKDF